jgi:hypothetical protein
MNQETTQPEKVAETAVSAEESSSPRLVNPSLSGSLAADHAALQNDLVQAQELAMDFQRQLAGKSNEYAQLKQILEKTSADLTNLQAGIVELRAERHRLANEAMRATAFEYKLTKVSEERDRLRNELEVVRGALDRKIEESNANLRDRDRRIADLVVETVRLRQAVDEARGTAPEPDSAATAAPTPKAAPPAPTTQPKVAAPPPMIKLQMEYETEPVVEVMPEAPRPLRVAR